VLCSKKSTVLYMCLTGNVTLHVYGQDDIVSNKLQEGEIWEKAEVREWLWALQQWQKPAAPANSNASLPYRPLAVDIGANLGWFSLQAAAAGARVAAFEGGCCQDSGRRGSMLILKQSKGVTLQLGVLCGIMQDSHCLAMRVSMAAAVP
jgi:hypothetical protein